MSATALPGKEVLVDTFISSSIWKLLCILLILINVKNLPFVFHLRWLNACRFVLRSERSRVPVTPTQLFQPLITESRGTLLELDYNMHKSNSTYFQDVDIARAHLICTLFSRGIEQARDSKGSDSIGGGDKTFVVALGAVSCSFRKEVNPFEKYEMWTRVLSWDQKWVYIVTHFVRKGAVSPRKLTLYPGQKNPNGGQSFVDNKEDAVIASALSKVVFKKGRLTIPPEVMLQVSGLLPPRPSDLALTPRHIRPVPIQKNFATEIYNVPFRFFERLDVVWEATRNALVPESEQKCRPAKRQSYDESEEKEIEWTWDMVEQERRRGLETAVKLHGLDGLVGEFTAEADALGRHSDLWWFLGLTY